MAVVVRPSCEFFPPSINNFFIGAYNFPSDDNGIT